MKICILCPGASIAGLSNKIKSFASPDVLWAGLNDFRPTETIIKKIDRTFSFLYISDITYGYLKPEIMDFLARGTDKVFVTSSNFYDSCLRCMPGHGSMVVTSYAKGIDLNFGTKCFYNSLSAFLFSLISLGHRDFILFGADGAGQYIKEYEKLHNDEITEQALKKDTDWMNKYFWKQVDLITTQPVFIHNASLKSAITCFPKIDIDAAANLLK